MLVTDAAEVLAQVVPIGQAPLAEKTGPPRAGDDLDAAVRRAMEALPAGFGAPAATVARDAGLPLQRTEELLRELEQRGLAVRRGSGWAVGSAPDAAAAAADGTIEG